MRIAKPLGRLLIAGLAAAPTLAQAPVPPPPTWSPTLDCAARVYAVDTLICGDAVLLKGARQVEDAYRRAAALQPDTQASLQADQLAWSKQRNMCVFEHKARKCVERLQADRIKALMAIRRAAPGP